MTDQEATSPNSFARTAVAPEADVVSSKPPFSQYDFIEDEFGGLRPLRRILSQVRAQGGCWIVVETIPSADDLQEENRDILSLCPSYDKDSREDFRLSFFSGDMEPSDINEIDDRRFLGYAIVSHYVVPVTAGIAPEGGESWRVYESVINATRHDNNYIRWAPLWKCRVGQREFCLRGYLYAQQNGITNSCAHVALRIATTRFGSDLSCNAINRMVRAFRFAQRLPQDLPGRGLSNQEICHVLKQQGAATYVGDYTQTPAIVPYQKYLYGSIESGYPAILFFRAQSEKDPTCHVVPLFGHTFNEDTWLPRADDSYFHRHFPKNALSSGLWTSMFIGHDDNLGSNYCIPQYYFDAPHECWHRRWWTFWRRRLCMSPWGSVAYAIGTMPDEVKSTPIEAEKVGVECISWVLQQVRQNYPSPAGRWLGRLQQASLESGHSKQLRKSEEYRLVLRTILVRGNEYAQHLRNIRGWDESKRVPEKWCVEIEGVAGDDLFWMIEISIPELFSANRRKVGEVVFRATQPFNKTQRFGNMVCARIPGLLVLPVVGTANGLRFFPIPMDDHAALFGCEDWHSLSDPGRADSEH